MSDVENKLFRALEEWFAEAALRNTLEPHERRLFIAVAEWKHNVPVLPPEHILELDVLPLAPPIEAPTWVKLPSRVSGTRRKYDPDAIDTVPAPPENQEVLVRKTGLPPKK